MGMRTYGGGLTLLDDWVVLLLLLFCRRRKLHGTLLEFLSYPKYQGKGVTYCPLQLLMMILMQKVKVAAMKRMRMMGACLTHQFCRQDCDF